jgi:hypothetical protein
VKDFAQHCNNMFHCRATNVLYYAYSATQNEQRSNNFAMFIVKLQRESIFIQQ